MNLVMYKASGRMPHPVGGAMGVTRHCREKGRGYTRFDIILSNIHNATLRWHLPGCCTLTSTADLLLGMQGTQPTFLQLFLRYSVVIYQCANASELICQVDVKPGRSPCGLQNMA